MDTITVISDQQKETVVSVSEVYEHRSLSSVLARAGFVLNTRCGQKGLCRGCEVKIGNGELVKSCQLRAGSVLGKSISIPERSLIQGTLSVAVDFQPRCGFEMRPLFESEDNKDFGICIDIGTTTVVMALIEMHTGKILDRESGYNAQVRIGEDVVTRIDACTGSEEALKEAQRLILVDTLAVLWERLSGRTGIETHRLAGGVVAGNTTMLHFFAGDDPSPMGKMPFTPRFLSARRIRHSTLPWGESGWNAPEDFDWYILPGYAAYVGADIAAGWLASGMVDAGGTRLLIDIGTNGEILLQHKGQLSGCATAAGPAFEGTQLSWGSRAIAGAVSRIHGNLLDRSSVSLEFVGKRKPRAPGFCGSAYIDFMAIGAECGLLKANGRFDRDIAESAGVRLTKGEYGTAWLLDPDDPEGPSISEADIALLLQAKAAIAAGIKILLDQSGVQRKNIETLYLAGGFGLNLGIESAITCGLLTGFREEQVEVVGNSSLGGAYICLLDRERASQLETSAKGVRIIELNEDPEFEDTYIDYLNLELAEEG